MKSWLERFHQEQDQKEKEVFDLLNVQDGHKFWVLGTQPLVISNCVQAAGHDLLLIWLHILVRKCLESGVNFNPWMTDFHDEALWEIDNSHVTRAKEIFFEESWAELNEICCKDSVVKLKGSGGVVKTLADAKCED